MKRFLLAVCFSLLTLGVSPALIALDHGPNEPDRLIRIQWYTNYNQAVQDAQSKRLPLLLFFTGSDWCGWCKKMHQEVFSSPEFSRAVGDTFVFVDIDFPKGKQLPPELAQQNAQLKQKYKITGYPTVVILDSNQNFIAEAGYRPGGGKAYADYLKQLLH